MLSIFWPFLFALVAAALIGAIIQVSRARKLVREIRSEAQTNSRAFVGLLEVTDDPVFLLDAAGRPTEVNASAKALISGKASETQAELARLVPLCRESEPGQPCDWLAELDRRPLDEPLKLRGLFEPDGERVFAAATRPLDSGGRIVVLHDLTASRRLEQEQERARRLESLAGMASGIAHDFNNQLTILLGNLSLIQSDGGLVSWGGALRESDQAIGRARDLADQLLTLAAGGTPQTRAQSSIELIQNATEAAFRGQETRFRLELPNDLRAVEVESQAVQQALAKLLIDCRVALGSGRLFVSASEIKVGAGQRRLRPGTYVEIELAGDGDALDHETLRSGSGFLAAAALFHRHRGSLDLEVVDSSAKVKMRLPVARTFSDESAKISLPAVARRGTVLVMDDERSIQSLLGAALRRLGFEAVVASDGRAALEARAQAVAEGKRFDLAILDLTIPGGMGGLETAAHLRSVQPDLLLVASSGYAQNPALVQFREHGFDQVLVKPYRIQDVANLLDAMLGSPS